MELSGLTNYCRYCSVKGDIMEISKNSAMQANYINVTQTAKSIQLNSQEDAQKLQLKMREESVSFSDLSFTLQLGLSTQNEQSVFEKNYEDFQNFLQDIGYDGPNIANLSQDEAKDLVADDGFFGVDKTSQRLSDFVINGAGDNESLLRAGRAGLLEGMKQAEEMWGSELPEISQKTVQQAIETIDKHMSELGYNIIDSEA